jgi:hypothetical protein
MPAKTPELIAQYDDERQQQLLRVQEALAVLTPKERDAIVLLDIDAADLGRRSVCCGRSAGR